LPANELTRDIGQIVFLTLTTNTLPLTSKIVWLIDRVNIKVGRIAR
jgi:hypothetical protein